MMAFYLDDNKKKRIHQLFETLIEEKTIPGCGVVLLTKAETWPFYLGVKDLDTKVLMDEKSLYDMASLTKVMVTGTLVLRGLAQGRLCLDDPLSKYLEDYDKDVTIQACLTHTSGYEAGRIDYRYMNKEALVQAVLLHPVNESIRGTCLYSDVNFILLGWVVEQCYGQPLDRLARELFDSLGMYDTCYCPKDTERCVSYEKTVEDGLIQGRVHDGKAYRLDGVSGHAGLFSTLPDLSIFLRMMLEKDERLLDAHSYELLDHIYTQQGREARTLAWSVRAKMVPFPRQAGTHTLYHSGFTGNFVLIDHDRDIAIGILSNRIHPNRTNTKIIEQMGAVYQSIYDILES